MIWVLMSTYNGSRYLNQQLDSIFKQTVSDLRVIVRDDASTDNTMDILESWKKKGYPIEYYTGENIGPAYSFWELLQNSTPQPGDYIAFADQDDVWKPNKLKAALNKLKNSQGANERKPMVYCSNVAIVDRHLQPLGWNNHKEEPTISLKAQLTCGLAPGCTMVMNESMVVCLQGCSFRAIPMHDTMVLLTGLCVGTVIYDHNPSILYRQHETNVEAMTGNSFIARRKKMLRRWFFNKENSIAIIAEDLLYHFKELSWEDQHTLEQVANYKKKFRNRIGIVKDKNFSSDNKKAKWSFRIRILLGRA